MQEEQSQQSVIETDANNQRRVQEQSRANALLRQQNATRSSRFTVEIKEDTSSKEAATPTLINLNLDQS